MEKLIVQKPFDYNGVRYREGAIFSPKDEGDVAACIKSGHVVKKVFAVPGKKSPVPDRSLKTQTPESKLQDVSIEKASDGDADEADQASDDSDDKPAPKRRRRLSPKKDD